MTTAFNENDIRPDDLVKKQQIFCDSDIAFLQSKKSDFIEVNCPSCDTYNSKVEFTKHTFEYIEKGTPLSWKLTL